MADSVVDDEGVVVANGNFVLDDGDFVLDDGDFVLDDGDFVLDDGDFVLDDGNFVLNDGDFVLELVAGGFVLDWLLVSICTFVTLLLIRAVDAEAMLPCTDTMRDKMQEMIGKKFICFIIGMQIFEKQCSESDVIQSTA